MISHSVLERAGALRETFESAKPFRHIAIDGFLYSAKIDRLIEQFPGFDPAYAVNEFGGIGGKDVHERLSDVGPAYRDLAAFAASDEMSGFLSAATGIPDLIWGGENMYGGGTHENLHGQGLAVHIDFNRNEPAGLHRRLNVLLYMNTEWSADWGGALELHADPRRPGDDWHVAFEPFANRVIIHETTEHSWHGFRPISLPEDRRHLSRKSIALYYYTSDRPVAETVGSHTTHYILPPLPESIGPNHVLSEAEYKEVVEHVRMRDQFIELYQRREVEVSNEVEVLKTALAGLREAGLPKRIGFVETVPGSLTGIWDDGWASARFSVAYRALRLVDSVTLGLFVPPVAEGSYRFEFSCGEHKVIDCAEGFSGGRQLRIDGLSIDAGETFELLLETVERPAVSPNPDDMRDLAAIVTSITCE